MSLWRPPLYFRYLAKLYAKNLFAILFGLSFAFAAIDYFQHIQELDVSGSYKILYIFFMWQEALGLLYPLAIVFALIMTKLTMVKQGTMGVLHAFGYSKKRLLAPMMLIAVLTYGAFIALHTTEFSYAKDKAKALLENQINAYNVNDLFFKYNDTFVYMKRLDPIHKRLENITIFKVKGHKILYTIHAPQATFDGVQWYAHDAVLKTHMYNRKGYLLRYTVVHKPEISTLKGYKPKIIESLYEGKALNIIDAYNTWKLLKKQHLNSDKIRSALYEKTVVPLFSLAMLLILFLKLPFHARMLNLGVVIALSLGTTFLVWGILFGLGQIGANGVLPPEITALAPIVLLWLYAIYLLFTDEKRIG
jgi:lipopolysaccharide export system permease protein